MTRSQSEYGISSVRIGYDEEGIGVVQPASALLAIAVVPEQGTSFPAWSQSGQFGAESLAESYMNFPNPFAAGRDETTFAFFLPTSGRVSLRLMTMRGEVVRTLLEGVELAPGMHQDTVWDGRNGKSKTVITGVYIAELSVRFDNGQSERHLHKVAVVR
jgi:hypothetical protein